MDGWQSVTAPLAKGRRPCHTMFNKQRQAMTDLFLKELSNIHSLTIEELYILQGDAHIFGDKEAFKVITREIEDREN